MSKKKVRPKQTVEVTINYTRSHYNGTDNLLAEVLKEVFEAAEAQYRAGLKTTNK